MIARNSMLALPCHAGNPKERLIARAKPDAAPAGGGKPFLGSLDELFSLILSIQAELAVVITTIGRICVDLHRGDMKFHAPCT